MQAVILLPIILIQVVIHFMVFGAARLVGNTHLSRKTWIQLVMLDCYANTLIGGHHKETISARMGRLLHTDRCVLCKWTCKLLDLIDENHCLKAHQNKEGDIK